MEQVKQNAKEQEVFDTFEFNARLGDPGCQPPPPPPPPPVRVIKEGEYPKQANNKKSFISKFLDWLKVTHCGEV